MENKELRKLKNRVTKENIESAKKVIREAKEMKTKEYEVKIEWYKGNKKVKELMRRCDLGVEGGFVKDSLSFITATKPNKKMNDKYKKAVEMANDKSDTEVRDIKISYQFK